MSLKWFVTGTDTGVGKSLVSAALLCAMAARGMKVAGMKPVASGARVANGVVSNEDVDLLLRYSSCPGLDATSINPYVFTPPVAPHLAARQAGISVRFSTIRQALHRLESLADAVVIEGAGGLLVPLGEEGSMADLCVFLQAPIILVVGVRLGCINHALLTVEALQARGLHLTGWVANCLERHMLEFSGNMATLEERIEAPLLGTIPFQPGISVEEVSRMLTPVC